MKLKSVIFKSFIILNIASSFFCKSGEASLLNEKANYTGFAKHDRETQKILEENLNVDDNAYNAVLAKEKFNVRDLYVLAMKRSEKIAVGAEDLIQSREKIRQAWGAILPQLSFRTNLYAYNPGLGAATGISGSPFSSGFRFYARQNLLTGLDEISGLGAAPLQNNYVISQLKTEAALLYDQIAQVFFEYLVLEDNLNTQKILLDNSTDLKRELEKRYNLGKVRRSEILSVEVMISKTQAVIVNLHTQLSNAQKTIRDLTGLSALDKNFEPEIPTDETAQKIKNDFFKSSEVNENMAENPPGNLYEKLKGKLEKRPDIVSLKTSWELSKVDSSRALGGHLPKIYLEGSYRLPDPGSTRNDYYGGIIAEVPLFSGGIVHSQYLAAKSRERQAELKYAEALRIAGEELSYNIHSWESGEKAREMLREALEKAENNYKIILSDYRIGQATNLEILSALNDAAAVKDEFEKTRLNQMLAIIHIKILTGELP